MRDMTSLGIMVEDKEGVLNEILSAFQEEHLNLTHINSKPLKFMRGKKQYAFEVNIDCSWEDGRVQKVYKELKRRGHTVDMLTTPHVPYFPQSIYDLDNIGKTILGEGDGI